MSKQPHTRQQTRAVDTTHRISYASHNWYNHIHQSIVKSMMACAAWFVVVGITRHHTWWIRSL